MKTFRADLHIHTLLSPCGSLEMSPTNIIKQAKNKKLDIIGITDHNTTKQCKEVYRLGKIHGISVFLGVEINTLEEIHCLAFFENFAQISIFQSFLNKNLPDIKNLPEKFGDQVWVDKNEMIVGEEKKLLISGLNATINQVERKVHRLNGLFIPAHIDRPMYSIISQLGFIPDDIKIDAVELADTSKAYNILSDKEKYTSITSSDAHYIEQIGTKPIHLMMKDTTFNEFKLCLKNKNGRKIIAGQ